MLKASVIEVDDEKPILYPDRKSAEEFVDMTSACICLVT